MIRRLRRKQIRPMVYGALLLLLVAARLLVAYSGRLFIMADGSALDDMLMVRAAMSLTQGNWLGAYSGWAMAKNMGFALWLWLLHTLRIPMLLGNALLWIAACLFAVRAVRRLFPGNLSRLILSGFLMFQPVSTAFFTYRAYRDSIYPAFCLLLFAGSIGLCLRLRQRRLRGSVLMALGTGIGLAGCWLLREDGIVLLVYAICATLFLAGFALWHPRVRRRLAKLLLSLLPFVVLAAGILGFSAANYANYGVFMVNDLSSGSFPRAYSAMVGVSRAESGYTGKTPVSREALDRLLDASPSLALLSENLLQGPALNGFSDGETGEFGGSFYYALRLAADYSGLTPDAQTAQTYWARVEAEINAAVTQGTLQSAGGGRSVVPRFHRSLLVPTAMETVYGGLEVLLFRGCDPTTGQSYGTDEQLAEVSAYLRAPLQTGYVEGTDEDYHNGLQRIVFPLLNLLSSLYALVVVPLFLYAIWRVFGQLRQGVRCAVKKQVLPQSLLLAVLAFGLLCSFAGRLVVAAYMEVAAFGIGTFNMYLSGGVPALLLFCAIGLSMPVPARVPQKRKRLSPLQTQGTGRDLRVWAVLALGAALLLAKLVLAGSQSVFLAVNESPLDDTLMVESAMSITGGQWLGEYGWKTLSKHSFFALWLAFLHLIRMPFLLGGQLLWAAAALATALAVMPVIKRRWGGLVLFGLMLFNPASVANPYPYAYITRVYRDNIFPALCTLCVAGFIGYALRYRRPLKNSVGWLVLSGLAFAACWLTREDGWWLLPFLLLGSVVVAFTILRADLKHKALRVACLLLPFLLLAGGLAGWAGMNKAYYGRFIISDFSGGEFADAYGAMTRVKHEEWDPKIAVPYDVRAQLYEHVPAFAELEPYLESAFYLERYSSGDYSSGAYYWALREAAAAAGYYDTPQKAQEYFAGLAAEINALCDTGVLDAGPKRSSVSPPIVKEYISPVVAEGFYNLWYVATFRGSDARSMLSLDDKEMNAPVEAYLRETALVTAREGTNEPYFSPLQNAAFRVFDILRDGYSVAVPVMLLLALLMQVVGGVRLARRIRKKRRNGWETLQWFIGLGLLACILLRCFMIAYVSVSSFFVGVYIMYLASVHPLVLLYGFLGTALFCRMLRRVRSREVDVPWFVRGGA